MRDEAQNWESLLARLFVDAELRTRFKLDPKTVGREFGLDESALAALTDTDWVGLDLAARSYSHKQAQRRPSMPGALMNSRFLIFLCTAVMLLVACGNRDGADTHKDKGSAPTSGS